MQRDVYAALIKKRAKELIPLRILQLSGEVTHEKIYDEVFDGHKLRRLILMTHMEGTDGSLGPKLGKDVMVENFSKLKRIHQPHYLYKLLPLLCDRHETFSCIQGIVSSAGSPFALEDRKDAQALRISFPGHSKWKAEVAKFLEADTDPDQLRVPVPERRLPLPNGSISYDAFLVNSASSSAASVNVVDVLNDTILKEQIAMNRLLLSPLCRTALFGSSMIALQRNVYAAKSLFHFVGVKKPLPQSTARNSLLQTAVKNGVHIYEADREGCYVYAL